MELTGSIKVLGDTFVVTDKFKKRDIVITDNSNDQYPQHVTFQFTQDKCDMLDKYKVGDHVTVKFNLQGREWTSPSGDVKYFNTLQGWFITKAEGVSNQPQAAAASQSGVRGVGPVDDLPF